MIDHAHLAFEWHKLRSLPGSLVVLGLYLVLTVGLSAASGAYLGSTMDDSPQPASDYDPVAFGTSGLRLGVIAAVVFGILAIGNEFKGGALRGSLLAVPDRRALYLSKLMVGGGLVLGASLITVPAAFMLSQILVGSPHSVGLGDPAVVRALLGAVFFATALTLFAIGLTAFLNSKALSIGILFPLLFMLSTILLGVPGLGKAAQFLPDNAGAQLLESYRSPDEMLTPLTGGLVLTAWVGIAVAAGWFSLSRRDVQ